MSVDYAIQYCVRLGRRFNITTTTLKAAAAIGGVFILALLKFGNPLDPRSRANVIIFYAIVGIASVVSLASAIASVFDVERKTHKYQTATRALRRLRDRYRVELGKKPGDAAWAQHLAVWAKDHVYEIESLLEDSRTVDVDFLFKISDPPPVRG